MKLSSSALLKAVWMELSSFWASCRCSPRAKTWAAFSWQNRAWARSRASSVRPRSSSRSWCIRWYCRRTSSFSSHTLSCGETKTDTQTSIHSNFPLYYATPCKISEKCVQLRFTPTEQSVKTYLHHTLVRVEFAELFFDLLHSLLHALLLSQQALLWGEKETEKKEKS